MQTNNNTGLIIITGQIVVWDNIVKNADNPVYTGRIIHHTPKDRLNAPKMKLKNNLI